MSTMKKKFGEYYLGLDVGTNSVGWAVTDLDYNLMRFNGKDMWGIRLFNSGETAENRRMKRSARRRGDRKKQRISLLQELFAVEITRVDPGFYQRLADSKFHVDDKSELQSNTLFNDVAYKDIDYHKEFPTIYHLRHALIEQKDRKFDVRLLYLAIAHILKNRGHFYFKGSTIEDIMDFSVLYEEFLIVLEEFFEDFPRIDDIKKLEELLIESTGIRDKQRALENLMGKPYSKLAALLAGSKVNLSDLFKDEELKGAEVNSVKLADSNFDEKVESLQDVLGDRYSLIETSKKLFDYGELARIQQSDYYSLDKIKSYEKHKDDLSRIKVLVRKHAGKDKYKEFFKDHNQSANYCAYIGESMIKPNSSVCSMDDMYSTIKKMILKDTDDPGVNWLYEQMEKGTLLPKQTTGANSVVPYQLHLFELERILSNAKKHHSFLLEKDQNGISVSDKIGSLLTFRIPYFVGPLNAAHADKGGNAWIVKKSDQRILPWNFEEVVDLDASQENFITRMTNKCTYLIGADVLPKQSILYSKYMVLNELNNVRIDGLKLDIKVKQKLYEELFLQKRRVTLKALKDFLVCNQLMDKKGQISGIDGDFKSNMSTFITVKEILSGRDFDSEVVDEIVRVSLIMGDEKRALERRIAKQFGDKFSEKEISKLTNMSFTGWGRLSRELLTEIYHTDQSTGECLSILSMLWNTNENFMQLMSERYDFLEEIDKYNDQFRTDTEFSYEGLVEPLYCSPAVKRGIWQALTIVQELRNIMGREPNRIFVEVTRGEAEKTPSKSRKTRLLELYKNCIDESRNWTEELKKYSEGQLRSKVLYLYYTQMGRCMYSGEPIDLAQIHNTEYYDIDHIYPRSLTKDDSFNNLVLVKKNLNREKGIDYPLPSTFQTPRTLDLWRSLKKLELISPEKYERLTRPKTDPLRDDELAGFISRQLVETSQSSKAIAEALKQLFQGSSEVVYVKSGHVSDFRHEYGFVKIRELNDLHHAKDAYLNIVVGNVYHTRFTTSPMSFIREARKQQKDQPYSLRQLFNRNVTRGKVSAWKTENDKSIQVVRKTIESDRIQFTRLSYEVKGAFYDEMPMKKGRGQIPLKSTDPRFKDIDKYGAYNKDAGAYFVLVEHTKKGKRVRSLEYVPVRIAQVIGSSKERLHRHCGDIESGLGLVDPLIIINKIKFDSLLYLDGYPMHITGRTGNQLIFKSAVQFYVDQQSQMYLRRVLRYKEKQKNDKNVQITEFDRLDNDSNLAMYDMFLRKIKESVYAKRPNSIGKILESGRIKFKELNNESQVEVLASIMSIYGANKGGVNLSLIGGASTAGVLVKSSEISLCKAAYLVNQSPTGLFETRIDLLKA